MGIRYGGSAIDFEAQSATTDCDPLQDEQIIKARKTVANWAADNKLDASEASELLSMLGINYDQNPSTLTTALSPNNLPNPKTPARR